MIQRTVGEMRFTTGEIVTCDQSTPEWCFKTAVSGSDDAVYAAAGLVRSLLDTDFSERSYPEHIDAIDWASDLLLGVCANQDISSYPEPSAYVRKIPPLVNATLDSTSCVATRTNNPDKSAEVIKSKLSGNGGLLIIGLGHGGTISAAKTTTAMQGEGAIFYPVRYSMTKHHDRKPHIDPEHELDYLRTLAGGRAVVVHDEDYGGGTTIRKAVKHLSRTLDTDAVMGYVPCTAHHSGRFEPTIVFTNDPYNQRDSL